MTDTTTQSGPASIAAFAARVRAELNDLPAEEVDELVDGLEADLADQAADAGEAFALPDAVAYAAELRAAAGLEPRASRRGAGGAALLERVRTGARNEWERAMQVPLLARAAGFVASLRPVWWLVRAWALYAVLASLLGLNYRVVGLPWNVVGWALLLALVVLSVQWGRGRWSSRRWWRIAGRAATVFAAVVLPFMLNAAMNDVRGAVYGGGITYASYDAYTPGLAVDGERVRNIFAYDAQGNPLDGVQLFDQNGSPLNTVGQEDSVAASDSYFNCGGGPVTVPLTVAGRGGLWNVYPLNEVPAEDACVDPANAQGLAAPAPRPYDSVAPIGQAATEPSAGPSPAPSGEPSAGPSAGPAGEPSPSAGTTEAPSPEPSATTGES